MAWNGAGNFQRTNGSYSGATVWQDDQNAGYSITASREDTHDQDIAQGINNCLAKDGQNAATAPLNIGNYRLTAVGSATARTDAPQAGQVQDGAFTWLGSSAGTSTAYTASLSPAITAYATGQRFTFKAHTANGAAATIAINGLAAKTIQRQGTALVGNEFIANDIIKIEYDGTNFQLLNVAPAPLFLDRTNNRVGIGTTTPSERLEVSGNQKFPASGISTIYSFAGSGTDVALDLVAGQSSYLSNGAAIRIQSSGAGNDGYILFSTNLSGTGSAERMRITNNGRLGIGTNAPSYQLQLSGDSAAKPTTNTWTIASDERIKTNIQPYAKGLEDICKVNPVTYDYNGKGGIAAGPGGVSILAQELQPVFPECVGSYKARLNDTDEEETDILNYNGHAITFALINAIKELSSKFESLEARIEALEA